MDQLKDDPGNLELLLRMAEFGKLVTEALSTTPDGALVADNVSIVVLCHLELDGPKRPNDIVEITGMTIGGVTKLITRLEDAALVARVHGALEQDKRAVSVSLTDKGHRLMRNLDNELGAFLSETAMLIKDLNQFVE